MELNQHLFTLLATKFAACPWVFQLEHSIENQMGL